MCIAVCVQWRACVCQLGVCHAAGALPPHRAWKGHRPADGKSTC